MKSILTILFSCPVLLSSHLENLEKRVAWELDHISYPAEWIAEEPDCLQVAIIGAGMAGIATAHGLFRLGIHQIALFDECQEGLEGPWQTYAQMKVLRTSKDATGPSLFIPSLTYQAWHEAMYGDESWQNLVRPTPKDFGNYLLWLRHILKLPVQNENCLKEIIPLADGTFELKFDGKPKGIRTKKIVLATGRKGCGGFSIPSIVKDLPKKFYAHTSEINDYTHFKGKKIGIIGSGTQAFDAAGAALEACAAKVDLLFRRKQIPTTNPFDLFAHVGIEQGFHKLPDPIRYHLIQDALENGTAPPIEAIERIAHFKEFHLHPESIISSITEVDGKLETKTTKQSFTFDFIILATGFQIDANQVHELKNLAPHILLWKDQLPIEKGGDFPYLGDHFQFLEKTPGKTPFLKHLYCFNYGALMSHGMTSSSIDGLSAGAEKLTQGIAADFFIENVEEFLEDEKRLILYTESSY